MPKEILRISSFEGGLDSSNDPRVITDNSLTQASGVSLDKLGKVTLSGGKSAHSYNANLAVNNALPEGGGLSAFSTDDSGMHITGEGQISVTEETAASPRAVKVTVAAVTVTKVYYVILKRSGQEEYLVAETNTNLGETTAQVASALATQVNNLSGFAGAYSSGNDFTVTKSTAGSFSIEVGVRVSSSYYGGSDWVLYAPTTANTNGLHIAKTGAIWNEISQNLLGNGDNIIDMYLFDGGVRMCNNNHDISDSNTQPIVFGYVPESTYFANDEVHVDKGRDGKKVGGYWDLSAQALNAPVESLEIATNSAFGASSVNKGIVYSGAGTSLTFVNTGTGDFIQRDDGGSFITDGFAVNDYIKVSGAATDSNNLTAQITAIVNAQITVADGNVLVGGQDGVQGTTVAKDLFYTDAYWKTTNMGSFGVSAHTPHLAIWIDEVGEGYFPSGDYKLYYSNVYFDGQESSLSDYQGSGTSSKYINLARTQSLKIGVYQAHAEHIWDYANSAIIDGISPRIIGNRFYLKHEDSSDYSLAAETNFTKGVRPAGAEIWTPWAPYYSDVSDAIYGSTSQSESIANTSPHNGGQTYSQSGKDLDREKSFFHLKGLSPITYYSLNGYNGDESVSARWKCSTVLNRRVYIGNVRQNGVTYGDRILKSPPNRPDTFPEDNFIDAVVSDGDEIVQLEGFADRILQFKKRSMYIINVSQDYEFLEASYPNKGINNPAASCVTDFGVVWVNNFGCFLYTGSGDVKDLTERDGVKIIDKSIWASFIVSPSIGYDPQVKKIIVIDNNKDTAETNLGNAYIYDMLTGSWTYEADFVVSGRCSNFVLDEDEVPLFLSVDADGSDDTETLYEWDNSPEAKAITLETKDYDFGTPSVSKKIYKVYVTYRNGSAGMAIQYALNGSFSYTSKYMKSDLSNNGTYDEAPMSDTTGGLITEELKPTTNTNNIKSIKFKITGAPAVGFELMDLSVIYRSKRIK